MSLIDKKALHYLLANNPGRIDPTVLTPPERELLLHCLNQMFCAEHHTAYTQWENKSLPNIQKQYAARALYFMWPNLTGADGHVADTIAAKLGLYVNPFVSNLEWES